MIAQIRTGLWVRNGFAIRGQLLHYRDYMLRELCYDQDLFILQTALVILPQDLVLVTILDRFGLLDYFSGSYLESQYEGTQLGSMVEEVFYVLITILSENSNPSKMPMDLAIRREIVHALAMGPCSFSDLVKRVAERLVDDPSFEGMLREVANFRPPEGPTETGLYELKDEAFDEVNPFFYHYTRNRREEVETILRKRIEKKTGKKEWEVVLPPKPFGVTEGPYKAVSKIWEGEAIIQIVFYALWNVLALTDAPSASGGAASSPPSAEAILDQLLHLAMLGVVERPDSFSVLASQKRWACIALDDEKTLVEGLWTLGSHEKYAKLYKARVDWVLDKIEGIVPGEVQRIRGPSLQVGRRVRARGVDKDEERKKAAKRRQELIMQQMRAQQESFVNTFADVDSDDDDDTEGDGDLSMLETNGKGEEGEVVSFGTCIVCQEDLNTASLPSKPFGSLGLVQPSRLVRRHPGGDLNYLNESLTAPLSLDRSMGSVSNAGTVPFPPSQADLLDARSTSHNFEGFPLSYTRFGLHGSACSHLMHLECFQVYSISIRQRHRSQATRNHPESIPRKEYICPLCKSLGNVILPIAQPDKKTKLSPIPFPDWIRAAGIHILKSKPDPLLESLQFRDGTGEFVFWSAQDPGYASALKKHTEKEKLDYMDSGKMLDTVMVVAKSISQQTRHLRDRMEPELTERGAGVYLPEELVGYTIATMEIQQRGSAMDSTSMVPDTLSDSQTRTITGLLACLTRLVALQFKNRPDEGRDAVRQAIIKRLLPEWSRTSLTSFSYPLLLRDPFTILVETAAVAPELLRHVLVLTYYACLARTVIGLVYILNKYRSHNAIQIQQVQHEDIFGDVRMFFMSVVRHSPIFEHTATLAFDNFGEARIEKLLYTFSLQFLRRAAILCRAVLPLAFPTPVFVNPNESEYLRLLAALGIPPLADLPYHDTLQNALSGWCAHYGHAHTSSQINCGVFLDYPITYKLARLPLVLDSLFNRQDHALRCINCETFPVDAAICLICGTTVCLQSGCCMDEYNGNRGECNMHTRECVSLLLLSDS